MKPMLSLFQAQWYACLQYIPHDIVHVHVHVHGMMLLHVQNSHCLLYTSDAADE